jgi:4-hydroxy-3-methylbut-2-en-1-yl diphosphate synthase IspG/GcpE
MNDKDYPATEIQSLVRDMDDSKKKHKALKTTDKAKYLEKLTEENQTLHFNYPSIFELHVDDKLDATFFYMLNQKRRIERGEITEDQATKEVGKKLADRWVAPVLSNTAVQKEETYEEYYKRISKSK